jgi:hypothetical protein
MHVIHVQGLPECSPEFAALFPDFVPTNKLQSKEDEVSETELVHRQMEVNRELILF